VTYQPAYLSTNQATDIDSDAFGELDLSGTDVTGRMGCMARRLADLSAQEEQLLAQLRFVRSAQRVALTALDTFIAQKDSL